jgi:hypothetical protein
MRAESILAYVRAKPFRPFRILMVGGKAYMQSVEHLDQPAPADGH